MQIVKSSALIKAIVLALLLAAFPQRMSAQLGISGSFQNSAYKDKDSGSESRFSGLQADLTYNIPFSRIVGLNLGAGYELLLRKEDSKIVSERAADCRSREQLIRVPIQLTINIPVSGSFGFLLYGGAAGVFAINGLNILTVKYEDGTPGMATYDSYSGVEGRTGMTDTQYAQAMAALDKSPLTRRYDIQAEGGLGIRINSMLMVRAGYTFGLLNRYSDTSKGFMRRNRINAGITLLF